MEDDLLRKRSFQQPDSGLEGNSSGGLRVGYIGRSGSCSEYIRNYNYAELGSDN